MAINISANMNLPIPVVGVETGPDWALNINSSLAIIDQHTHTSGSGVQITPNGLNINSDLTFLSNNATALRSLRFTPQTSNIALPADVGCLYEVTNDLYYNDGLGNQIRITQSGAVAGAAGTITGLPSGTASASFAAGTFVFQSATLTGANMDVASLILRNNTASSFGLTLNPPNAMAANYSLTAPQLPAANNTFVTIDTSGNMGSSITVDNSSLEISSSVIQVKAAGIVQSSLYTRTVGTSVSAGNVAQSAIATLNTTSTSPVAISAAITIVTTGRPVIVMVVGDSDSYVTCLGANGAIADIYFNGVATFRFRASGNTATANSPITQFMHVPAAGTHTYQLYGLSASGTNALFSAIGIIAYEI
jgi:hypothetical protein